MALRTNSKGGWEVERAVPSGPYSRGGLAISYTVAGTLVPDVTGEYYHHGYIGGQPYFKLTTGTWYLWPTSPAADEWVITNARWETGTAWWVRSVPPIHGIYAPQGTATGAATVTVTP